MIFWIFLSVCTHTERITAIIFLFVSLSLSESMFSLCLSSYLYISLSISLYLSVSFSPCSFHSFITHNVLLVFLRYTIIFYFIIYSFILLQISFIFFYLLISEISFRIYLLYYKRVNVSLCVYYCVLDSIYDILCFLLYKYVLCMYVCYCGSMSMYRFVELWWLLNIVLIV